VVWAQACLSRLLGVELPHDGLVGPETQQAIASFQTEQNLPSTRTLDDNTVSALQALCAAREESGHPEPGEYEEYDVNEPEPQQWPKSRIFNPPPAQIVPAGPYQTPSLCQSILDDHSQLLFAVTELKSWLRRRPSNPATVVNRSDMVRNLSRKIVARLQNREYVALGCTQRDFHVFASSVDALRGGGADSDSGSWPLAQSASEQEARRAARESLRHLLAWIRRAFFLRPIGGAAAGEGETSSELGSLEIHDEQELGDVRENETGSCKQSSDVNVRVDRALDVLRRTRIKGDPTGEQTKRIVCVLSKMKQDPCMAGGYFSGMLRNTAIAGQWIEQGLLRYTGNYPRTLPNFELKKFYHYVRDQIILMFDPKMSEQDIVIAAGLLFQDIDEGIRALWEYRGRNAGSEGDVRVNMGKTVAAEMKNPRSIYSCFV
jgi:hypothetical protein